MEQYIQNFFQYIEAAEYGVVLLSIIVIFCTFILEDPTTLFVGGLIAQGKITYAHGFISLMVGISLGDFYLYSWGRFFGKKKFKWSEYLKKIKINLYSLLFLARFVPGMRLTFYPFAGIQGIKVAPFLIINIASSIIWTALLIEGAQEISRYLEQYPFYYFIILIVVVILLELLLKRVVLSKIASKHGDNVGEP